MSGTATLFLIAAYVLAVVVGLGAWGYVWMRWWDEWLTPRFMRWWCRRHGLAEDYWERFR